MGERQPGGATGPAQERKGVPLSNARKAWLAYRIGYSQRSRAGRPEPLFARFLTASQPPVDIRHQDSKFPGNLEEFEARKDLSQETKRKVLYENARRLFNL